LNNSKSKKIIKLGSKKILKVIFICINNWKLKRYGIFNVKYLYENELKLNELRLNELIYDIISEINSKEVKLNFFKKIFWGKYLFFRKKSRGYK
jgi:hypothetical protein